MKKLGGNEWKRAGADLWRRGLLLAAAASFALGIGAAPAAALEPDWVRIIDFKIPVYLIGNPKAIVRWERDMALSFHAQPAIGPDGTIYISSYNSLRAVHADGPTRWEVQLKGQVYGPPAIGYDGTVYVTSDDNKLYAIQADGSKKWEAAIGGSGALNLFQRLQSSPVVGPDGTIYAASTDEAKLFAFKPNGTRKWVVETGGAVTTPAVGPDGTVYAGALDSKLYAVNPGGSIKWTYTAARTIVQQPTIGPDGTIYVGAYKSYVGSILNAVRPDGTLLWSQDHGSFTGVAIGPDGTLYAGGDPDLVMMNPDGTLKLKVDLKGHMRKIPVIGSDGTIYVTTDSGKLYAVQPDGSIKWEYNSPGVLVSIPANGSDGTVYAQSYSTLAALGTVAVSSVKLNSNTLSLLVGGTQTLTATVVPDDAVNKRIKWGSSNPAVADVDETGKVSGVAVGTSRIVAMTEDGGFTAMCEVTVSAAPASEPPAQQPEPEEEQPDKEPVFLDVAGHPYREEIGKAAALGFIRGYPDGTFRPDAGVTRAEFAVMLISGMKIDPDLEGEQIALAFRDRGEIGSWSAQSVAHAVKLKVISGYEDGTFRPNAGITHAEMISMVVRASGLPAGETKPTGFADDADIPGWARGAVSKAEEMGIVIARDAAERFHPQAPSTRAEASAAIVRMLEALP